LYASNADTSRVFIVTTITERAPIFSANTNRSVISPTESLGSTSDTHAKCIGGKSGITHTTLIFVINTRRGGKIASRRIAVSLRSTRHAIAGEIFVITVLANRTGFLTSRKTRRHGIRSHTEVLRCTPRSRSTDTTGKSVIYITHCTLVLISIYASISSIVRETTSLRSTSGTIVSKINVETTSTHEAVKERQIASC
jgi:hypothetical protein